MSCKIATVVSVWFPDCFSLPGLGDDLLIESDTMISDMMSTMKSQCG